MTDDAFRADGGEGIDEVVGRPPMSRRSTATDEIDVIFDVLRDSRRRYLLYVLVAVDEDVVELSDAADAVREYEAAGTEAVGESPPKGIRIALHHDHLPRLADTEILDYDPRQGTIRFTGHGELEEWVELARARELE